MRIRRMMRTAGLDLIRIKVPAHTVLDTERMGTQGVRQSGVGAVLALAGLVGVLLGEIIHALLYSVALLLLKVSM